MFGHQDDNKQQNDQDIPEQTIDGAMAAEVSAPQDSTDEKSWQHPGAPIDQASDQSSDANQPAEQSSNNDQSEISTPDPAPVAAEETPHFDTPVHQDKIEAQSGDLAAIKLEALSKLTPLVGHLDQSPEERFRTTMMMIQASDNQELVKDAYEAANSIEDESARAQALLDVINEINYFTQPKTES